MGMETKENHGIVPGREGHHRHAEVRETESHTREPAQGRQIAITFCLEN